NLDANEQAVTLAFDPTDINSYNSTYTTKVFDSQGKEHTLTQYFVKTGDNAWDSYNYIDGKAASSVSIDGVDSTTVPTIPPAAPAIPPPVAIASNANGHMTSPYDYAGVLANDPANAPDHADIVINATNLT